MRFSVECSEICLDLEQLFSRLDKYGRYKDQKKIRRCLLMNRDEELAETYLQCLAPKHLLYEPNGRSKAPDFEVCFDLKRRIGVEVRRLNLHHQDRDIAGALEEHSIPLMMKMKNMVTCMQSPSAHHWYLCYEFGRTRFCPRRRSISGLLSKVTRILALKG